MADQQSADPTKYLRVSLATKGGIKNPDTDAEVQYDSVREARAAANEWLLKNPRREVVSVALIPAGAKWCVSILYHTDKQYEEVNKTG